jgi:hypothetical protein
MNRDRSDVTTTYGRSIAHFSVEPMNANGRYETSCVTAKVLSQSVDVPP